jgi:hypothetical protein
MVYLGRPVEVRPRDLPADAGDENPAPRPGRPILRRVLRRVLRWHRRDGCRREQVLQARDGHLLVAVELHSFARQALDCLR